jgi:hypothetical protein
MSPSRFRSEGTARVARSGSLTARAPADTGWTTLSLPSGSPRPLRRLVSGSTCASKNAAWVRLVAGLCLNSPASE